MNEDQELLAVEFLDDKKQKWLVCVDLMTRRKLLNFSGFELNNLVNVSDKATFDKHVKSLTIETLEDILWLACESQAQVRQMDQEAFFGMLSGKFFTGNPQSPFEQLGSGCYSKAMEATEEALVNFTRNRGGDLVGKMWSEALRLQKQCRPTAEQKKQVEEMIMKASKSIGTELSSNINASLESATAPQANED